jgi:hypothetical protein
MNLRYETEGGAFSEALALSQLIEHMRLGAEAAYIIGHNRKENGDLVNGQGFLAIGQLLEKVCMGATQLATKGVRQ